MQVEIIRAEPMYVLTLTHEEAKMLRTIVGNIRGGVINGVGSTKIRKFVNDVYHNLSDAGAVVSDIDGMRLPDEEIYV